MLARARARATMMRPLVLLALSSTASAWWKDEDTKTRGEVSAVPPPHASAACHGVLARAPTLLAASSFFRHVVASRAAVPANDA
jgi:hypothetical protein